VKKSPNRSNTFQTPWTNHCQGNDCQGNGENRLDLIPLTIIPLTTQAIPEKSKTGRKMGAKKSLVFMFLPPSFCLPLSSP
jgi:hypothetical protein